MNTHLQIQATDHTSDSRRLIAGLKQALDMSYTRVLETARKQWERNFEGNDPSDACVRVRVTAGKPCAGILKRPARSFLNGSGRRSLA